MDERLFGWSPSAFRYTGETTTEENLNEDSIPAYSDEDISDYDDLLGFIDNKRPPSRNSSYADLRLRKVGRLTVNPALDADGCPATPRG